MSDIKSGVRAMKNSPANYGATDIKNMFMVNYQLKNNYIFEMFISNPLSLF